MTTYEELLTEVRTEFDAFNMMTAKKDVRKLWDLPQQRNLYVFNESQSNDLICEGFGGSAKGTTKVSVKVGSLGRVSLFLCDTCKTKFMHSNIGEQDGVGSHLQHLR